MYSRRNFFIRSVITLGGDFALGFALGSTCAWIIQSASLGLFLAFLMWLLAVIAALSLSQHALHPVVQFALSDHKLNAGLAATANAERAGTDAAQRLWAWGQHYGLDLRPGPSA